MTVTEPSPCAARARRYRRRQRAGIVLVPVEVNSEALSALLDAKNQFSPTIGHDQPITTGSVRRRKLAPTRPQRNYLPLIVKETVVRHEIANLFNGRTLFYAACSMLQIQTSPLFPTFVSLLFRHFPDNPPNMGKLYHRPTATGTVTPLQPSDGMILVIGQRLEGHSVIFLAIQTHLSCRFLLAVDSLGRRRNGSSS